jgi:hypothetical protein
VGGNGCGPDRLRENLEFSTFSRRVLKPLPREHMI